MAPADGAGAQCMRRLYDKIGLLALLAVLFWAASYLVWGLLDVFSVPVA